MLRWGLDIWSFGFVQFADLPPIRTKPTGFIDGLLSVLPLSRPCVCSGSFDTFRFSNSSQILGVRKNHE